jgi:hypothetical protein
MARSEYVRFALSLLALGGSVACGGPANTAAPSTAAAVANKPAPGVDDQSRCDFKGRPDREVVESNGPGALQPNVRRVFGILGEGDDRRRVLFCREIDTNLDGVKDVVRTYKDKGDAVDESADTNYDGKVDTWIRFSAGRISKVDLDTTGDGRPDETRYYVKGQISRVQRDTNNDGKPDVWEIYSDGQLERMGTDLDFDGHVDRWDRDEVAHRAQEEKDREEQQKADDAKKAEDAANAASAGKPAPKPMRPTDDGSKRPAPSTAPVTAPTTPATTP